MSLELVIEKEATVDRFFMQRKGSKQLGNERS